MIVIQHCSAWLYDFATQATKPALLNQQVCSDLGYVSGLDLVHDDSHLAANSGYFSTRNNQAFSVNANTKLS
jgi:hypothetical protein